MKKIFIAAIASLTFIACNDGKKQEKALLDDVIKLHDKVMGNDYQLMRNKMKIDTLLITAPAPQKTELTQLSANLVVTETAMENWMQKFDPEQKGKSHEEIVAYLNSQKKQIAIIDSQMNLAINKSSQYISQLKK